MCTEAAAFSSLKLSFGCFLIFNEVFCIEFQDLPRKRKDPFGKIRTETFCSGITCSHWINWEMERGFEEMETWGPQQQSQGNRLGFRGSSGTKVVSHRAGISSEFIFHCRQQLAYLLGSVSNTKWVVWQKS